MAVNFANFFMDNFEEDLLKEYESKHSMKPFILQRYIDDVFVVWVGSEESRQHFIQFVKSYSTGKNMLSVIYIKDVYSNSSVKFPDTVVQIENNTLTINHYSKPTLAYDYVHQSSYHPQHLIKAMPNGKFTPLRRIRTQIREYRRHAENFIKHFRECGYSIPQLRKNASDIENKSSEEFLTYKPKVDSNRVPHW